MPPATARPRLALVLALLVGLGAAGCGDPPAPAPPPRPTGPVPEGLVGTWLADGAAVEATVLRFLRDRAELHRLPPEERAAAEADLRQKATEFAADWSMELALHADWTFAYKLRQPRAPTYLRAGGFRLEGTLLTLHVEETRNEKGGLVQQAWRPEWLHNKVRWERNRLRFQAPGRETFEFLLYRK